MHGAHMSEEGGVERVCVQGNCEFLLQAMRLKDVTCYAMTCLENF